MDEEKNHSRRRFLGGLVAASAASAVAVAAQGQGMGMDMMGPSKNKVVYQVNKSDSAYILDILHSAAVVLQHYNNDVSVVMDCFGPGIWLLVKPEKSQVRYSKFVEEQVSSLHMYGVEFAACEQTMKTVKLSDGDLIPEARKVFSGAVELITLQQQGYAYIAW